MKMKPICSCARTPGRREALRRGSGQALALLAAFGVTPDVLAQDAAKTAPRAYRVALDNEHVRVLEFAAKPNSNVCGAGMHSHPKHVTIALTDAKVRVTMEGGTPVVKDVAAGAVFWRPAEVHRAESVGGAGTRFFIIELKDKDWLPSTG